MVTLVMNTFERIKRSRVAKKNPWDHAIRKMCFQKHRHSRTGKEHTAKNYVILTVSCPIEQLFPPLTLSAVRQSSFWKKKLF